MHIFTGQRVFFIISKQILVVFFICLTLWRLLHNPYQVSKPFRCHLLCKCPEQGFTGLPQGSKGQGIPRAPQQAEQDVHQHIHPVWLICTCITTLNKSASTCRQANLPIIHCVMTHVAAHLHSRLQHTNARNATSLEGGLLQHSAWTCPSCYPETIAVTE